MTDNITSQNTELSSWITLYVPLAAPLKRQRHGFRTIITVNTDYFTKQHSETGHYNSDGDNRTVHLKFYVYFSTV